MPNNPQQITNQQAQQLWQQFQNVFQSMPWGQMGMQQSPDWNQFQQFLQQGGTQASGQVSDFFQGQQAQSQGQQGVFQGFQGSGGQQFGQNMDPNLAGFFQQFLQQQQSGIEGAQQFGQQALEVQQLNFDAQMARNNFMYQRALGDIERNRTRGLNVAQANAAALNPYSEARGAQTATNFQNAIHQKYQRIENDVHNMAMMAQQELQAGNAAAVANIQQNVNNMIATANRETQQSLLALYNIAENQRQFELNFDLKKQEIENEEMKFNLDRAQNLIENFSMNDELQNIADEWVQTGGEAEMPVELQQMIDLGNQAGMEPEETMAWFRSLRVPESERIMEGLTVEQMRADIEDTRAATRHRYAQIAALQRPEPEEVWGLGVRQRIPSYEEWIGGQNFEQLIMEEENRLASMNDAAGIREMRDRIKADGKQEVLQDIYLNRVMQEASVPMAIEEAWMAIPPDQKWKYEAQAKNIQGLLARGEYEPAKNMMKNIVTQELPAQVQRQVIGRNTFLDTLREIEIQVGDTKTSGLRSTVSNIMARGGFQFNEDFTELENLLNYAAIRSGLEAGEGSRYVDAEIERLVATLPNVRNRKALNETRISSLINAVEMNQRSTYQTYINPGLYERLWGSEERFRGGMGAIEQWSSSYESPSGQTFNLPH